MTHSLVTRGNRCVEIKWGAIGIKPSQLNALIKSIGTKIEFAQPVKYNHSERVIHVFPKAPASCKSIPQFDQFYAGFVSDIWDAVADTIADSTIQGLKPESYITWHESLGAYRIHILDVMQLGGGDIAAISVTLRQRRKVKGSRVDVTGAILVTPGSKKYDPLLVNDIHSVVAHKVHSKAREKVRARVASAT